MGVEDGEGGGPHLPSQKAPPTSLTTISVGGATSGLASDCPRHHLLTVATRPQYVLPVSGPPGSGDWNAGTGSPRLTEPVDRSSEKLLVGGSWGRWRWPVGRQAWPQSHCGTKRKSDRRAASGEMGEPRQPWGRSLSTVPCVSCLGGWPSVHLVPLMLPHPKAHVSELELLTGWTF